MQLPSPPQAFGAGGASPQASTGRTGHGQATVGWDYKGVSTNNRKRVLPSSRSFTLAGEEVRGQARGTRTVQAFVFRQAWSVGMQLRGRWWTVDGRPLCFGKRQNPDAWGREPACLPACQESWLLLQAPQNLKAPRAPSRWQSPRQPQLPAIGQSPVQALSRPPTAELLDQGRTKALGRGMDSNMVRETFLGVCGGPLGWGGGH